MIIRLKKHFVCFYELDLYKPHVQTIFATSANYNLFPGINKITPFLFPDLEDVTSLLISRIYALF